MKHILFAFLLLPLMLCAEKFTVETIFRPAVVSAGEPVEITLISNKRGNLKFELPEVKGAQWLRNYVSSSTQTSIVNGVVTVSVRRTIPLIAEKSGNLVIPPFTVTCGKEQAQTREIVIKVLTASERAAVADAVPEPAGEMLIPGGPRKFYAGEEIPLVLLLQIPAGVEVRELSYPEIRGLGSAVLTDFSKINPRNRFFAPPVERRRVIGNREYTEVVFRTSFRALKAESISPEAVASLGIVQRTRNRRSGGMFEDDFFDGFFSSASARVIPRQIPFKFKGGPVTILPLPALQGNSLFLNLVGPWRISAALGSTTAKVGEPVELTLTLAGGGSGETLKAPVLQLPGFRVYPPEVKRLADRIEVKYALIPLETGEKNIALSFAVFDPAAGKYVIENKTLILPVSPGTAVPGAVVKVSAERAEKSVAEKQTEPEKEQASPVRSELFYQKSAPGKTIRLPLVLNQLSAIAAVLLCGIIVSVFFMMRKRHFDREAGDAAYRIRHQLRNQLADSVNQLKKSGFSGDAVREIAVPFLAQSMGLAPGSSPEEVAEKIQDPELAAWFRELNHSGFLPGTSASGANPIRIKALLKAMKKVGILLVCCFSATLLAGFNTAFDAGKYEQAAEEYNKYIQSGRWSAHALYNLGSVYFAQGDLPRARLCLMRAHLLDPMDSETLENLNLVNRKLMQNESGSTATPGELVLWCRDRFRPDQYLLFSAVVLAGLLIAVSLHYRLKGTLWYWIISSFGVLLILFIAAAASQMNGPYNTRNAIVTAKQLELRTLPASGSRVEATVPGGSSARIVESRDNWCRIKVNGQDGWVGEEGLESVLPGGLW